MTVQCCKGNKNSKAYPMLRVNLDTTTSNAVVVATPKTGVCTSSSAGPRKRKHYLAALGKDKTTQRKRRPGTSIACKNGAMSLSSDGGIGGKENNLTSAKNLKVGGAGVKLVRAYDKKSRSSSKQCKICPIQLFIMRPLILLVIVVSTVLAVFILAEQYAHELENLVEKLFNQRSKELLAHEIVSEIGGGIGGGGGGGLQMLTQKGAMQLDHKLEMLDGDNKDDINQKRQNHQIKLGDRDESPLFVGKGFERRRLSSVNEDDDDDETSTLSYHISSTNSNSNEDDDDHDDEFAQQASTLAEKTSSENPQSLRALLKGNSHALASKAITAAAAAAATTTTAELNTASSTAFDHSESETKINKTKINHQSEGDITYETISPPLVGVSSAKLLDDAIIIDKIKGIEFPSALTSEEKMGVGNDASNNNKKENGKQDQVLKEQDNIQILNNDVECSNNNFDQLIQQKMRSNDISRPIVTDDGRFDNPFSTWPGQPSYLDVMKFLAMQKADINLPKTKEELDKELPILKPNFNIDQSLVRDEDYRVTWLGHATLLIQTEGLNIITDPMFSDKASPVQLFGPKRYRQPACQIRDLPRIDLVLISHNHYDHLDAQSVKEINDRFGRRCRWIVPLGVGDFLKSSSVENYVELDWWQKDCSHFVDKTVRETGSSVEKRQETDTTKELAVYLTPTQHSSRRGISDYNKSLWGSYVIINSSGSKFFFNGDTAYCQVYKEIEMIFGPMTGAAIPIGAYNPRWFLKPHHVDPKEAIDIHLDLKSMKSIPIHHSTFPLSYEDFKEPVTLLNKLTNEMKANGTIIAPFEPLKHGETTVFSR